MKITKHSIYRFALPLKKPLLLGRQTVCERVGLLLKLTDSSGQVGWGEISPLPSFSVETLEEAEKDLRKLCSELKDFDLSKFDITKYKPLAHLHLTSSVQFGLEMALLKLSSPAAKPTEDIAVNVNGLIVKLDSSAIIRAQELVSYGYKSIKIKIGRTDYKIETELIREIAKNLPSNVTLRLDANQSFRLDEAIAFCHEVENCKIEYIEEPLADPAELKELTRQTSIRFALDETLSATLHSVDKVSVLKLLEPDSIAAIVIKPTLIGGLHESIRLAKVAKQTDTNVVISSAYESQLGLACLSQLANLLAPNGVHGLATLEAFENQLTTQTLTIESGRLIIPSSFSHTPIDSMIEEIFYE